MKKKKYKSNLPLVSIVTPSYNTLNYIKKTIESVKIQKYPNIEHIIMDGMSNDGTIQYCNSLENIKFISKKDKGQSNAINKALDLCNGDFIGWINSDDTYNSGTIEFIVDYFKKHPEIEYLHSDVNIIDENCKVIGKSEGEELTLNKILTKNPIKQPSLFMRKSMLNKLGRLNEKLHFVMDMEFWLRIPILGIQGKYITDQIFSNFRMMKGTKSMQYGSDFIKEWIGVLQQYSSDNYFSEDELVKVNKAISYLRGSWHIEIMKNTNEGFISVLKNFINALKHCPSLIKNLGIWIFLFESIIGFKMIKNARFRKRKK